MKQDIEVTSAKRVGHTHPGETGDLEANFRYGACGVRKKSRERNNGPSEVGSYFARQESKLLEVSEDEILAGPGIWTRSCGICVRFCSRILDRRKFLMTP